MKNTYLPILENLQIPNRITMKRTTRWLIRVLLPRTKDKDKFWKAARREKRHDMYSETAVWMGAYISYTQWRSEENEISYMEVLTTLLWSLYIAYV
jgi:hypothetical protein